MSDFNRGNDQNGFSRDPRVAAFGQPQAMSINQGLRAYMIGVYNNMLAGLVITGIAAYLTYMLTTTNDPSMAVAHDRSIGLTQLGVILYTGPMRWVMLFAPVAFVLVLQLGINKISAATARLAFFVYATLTGMSLSVLFLIYTQTSITQAFFITATAFGALSVYGYTTKRDLGPIGCFLIMATWGLCLTGLLMIFFPSQSGGMLWSGLVLLVFAGLTAYDTQWLRQSYSEGNSMEVAQKTSIYGALMLYMDFINMFMAILRLTGSSRD